MCEPKVMHTITIGKVLSMQKTLTALIFPYMEKRKTDELIGVVKEAFRSSFKLTYQELCEVLMREMEIKDRTAKKYIAYMKEQRILIQDTSGNYQKGELCHT